APEMIGPAGRERVVGEPVRVLDLGEKIGLGHHTEHRPGLVDHRYRADAATDQQVRDFGVTHGRVDGGDVPGHHVVNGPAFHRCLLRLTAVHRITAFHAFHRITTARTAGDRLGPSAVGPSALPPGGSSAFTEAAGSAAANRLHRLLPGGMVVGV